jgi:hypothetical protein
LPARRADGLYMTNDKFSMTNSQSFQSPKSSPRLRSAEKTRDAARAVYFQNNGLHHGAEFVN